MLSKLAYVAPAGKSLLSHPGDLALEPEPATWDRLL